MKMMMSKLPIVSIAKQLYWRIASAKNRGEQAFKIPFNRSTTYWEDRYTQGGNSGAGSYGILAEFKAKILNRFVANHAIHSVIEFGSGDGNGNQLKLSQYQNYIGVDVSNAAVLQCRNLFQADPSKHFIHNSEYHGEKADLSLSLDVIYHLVEDEIYEAYMKTLFDAAKQYVIIFTSNTDDNAGSPPHIHHRMFTKWIDDKPEWKLIQHVPNEHPFKGDNNSGSFADFYIFERI